MTYKYDPINQTSWKNADRPCGCKKTDKRFRIAVACNDKITYRLYLNDAPETPDLPNDDAYRALFRRALDIVAKTCGTGWEEVFDDSAIVEISFGNTGRGVLAWSHVGFSCRGGAEQEYGSQWDWEINGLLSTILHEIGHLLGLDHDNCVNPDGESNIMCWQIRDDELIYYDRVTAENLRDIWGDPFDGPITPPDPPDPPNPPDPPAPPEVESIWPLQYYYGEPFRNFFKFLANSVWYLFNR